MVRSCVSNADTLSAFTANWGSVFHCGMVAHGFMVYAGYKTMSTGVLHTVKICNGIAFGSAVLHGSAQDSDRTTDRDDGPRYSVSNNRPHLCIG